jgi:hypothetical protein
LIQNNYFEECSAFDKTSGSAIAWGSGDRVYVINNSIIGGASAGITFNQNGDWGRTRDVVIDGNVIRGGTGEYGILLSTSNVLAGTGINGPFVVTNNSVERDRPIIAGHNDAQNAFYANPSTGGINSLIVANNDFNGTVYQAGSTEDIETALYSQNNVHGVNGFGMRLTGENINVMGGKVSGFAGAAFFLGSGNSLIVDGTDIKGTSSDGTNEYIIDNFTSTCPGGWNRQVFKNLNIEPDPTGTSSGGIESYACDGQVVEILDNNMDFRDTGSGSTTANGIQGGTVIRGNTIRRAGNRGIVTDPDGTAESVLIADNHLYDTVARGIWATRGPLTIRGNSFFDGDSHAIEASSGDLIRIQDNYFKSPNNAWTRSGATSSRACWSRAWTGLLGWRPAPEVTRRPRRTRSSTSSTHS